MPKNTLFNKESVLDLLIPIFISKGYNGTSMQDIVASTNLNRSSIYNTFGDKLSLYQQVLEHYTLKQQSLAQKILDLDLNTKHALKVFYQKIFLEEENTSNNGCLLTNCSLEMAESHKNIQHKLSNNMNGMVSIFEKVIEIGQSKTEIKATLTPYELALLLYNQLHGLRVTQSNGASKKDLAIIIDQFFTLI